MISFHITNLEKLENYNGSIQSNLIKHRIFAQNSNIQSSKFALNASEKLLNEMIEYFHYPYENVKLDQIGIPDFPYGAKHSWGTILQIKKTLFHTNEQSTYDTIAILETIAHEFVHSWFGSLVTPEERGYIWLSEGLATLFGPMMIEHYIGEPNFIDFHTYQDCQWAKDQDSISNTHAMSLEIYDTESIEKSVDYVSYEKGNISILCF